MEKTLKDMLSSCSCHLRQIQTKNLSELHDTALEYDSDIQTTTDAIVEYRNKMYDKKDAKILGSIIPLLDTLIYEAQQYKEWIGEVIE